MADLRITPGLQTAAALTPVQPAARAEAVKAAQRAFFNAALAQTQAPSNVKPAVAAATIAQSTATRSTGAAVEDPSPTDRFLRPGSLLDIKV